MTAGELLVAANAAATWAMCGVIWFVQVVHYPLFGRFDRADFPAAMADHQRRTFYVVFPPMAVELVTAVALLAVRPAGVPGWLAWVGAGLVGVWGVSTAAVQIPLHERLEEAGFDPAVAARLVASNWVRTAAWSARGVVCGAMAAGLP